MSKINLEKINGSKIRRHYDEESRKWYFSIVDVIEIVANTTDAQNYWKVLKNRLKKGQNELVTACNQLKMRAKDGKMYLTDVADMSTMLELIKTISEESVPSFRLWFSKIESVGENRQIIENDAEEVKLLFDGYQTEKDIIIESMVAGAKVEDLSLTLDYQTLTITGKILVKENISEENKFINELYWGKFSRVIPLPTLVEIDEAEVTLYHGLLKIKLPKINLDRTRDLKIKSIS
jgi:HSP20 family molecular chaperone IbpA